MIKALISPFFLIGFCLITACAHHPVREEVLWVAHSKEWKEQSRAAYAEATDYVERIAKTRAAGSWAVVLDLDETVLSNIGYMIERDQQGKGFTEESWSEWILNNHSPLVPGVKPFIKRVNALGGHIAFITNRSDRLHLATEQNLEAFGLSRVDDFKILLTRPLPLKQHKNKEPRFKLVKPMLAMMGYPNVKTVAYIGDNEGDKPKNGHGFRFFCLNQGKLYGNYCHR